MIRKYYENSKVGIAGRIECIKRFVRALTTLNNYYGMDQKFLALAKRGEPLVNKLYSETTAFRSKYYEATEMPVFPVKTMLNTGYVRQKGDLSMGKVNVVIVDATGNKEQKVGLPDDIKCGIIMVKLVEKIKLPSVGPDGNPISYKFIHKVTGRQLLEAQTLGEAGIKDGDVLRLQPEITAGGLAYGK